MATISTKVCDVKDCHRQLSKELGSSIEVKIKTPPHSPYSEEGYMDLCDVHLAEFQAKLATLNLELIPNV